MKIKNISSLMFLLLAGCSSVPTQKSSQNTIKSCAGSPHGTVVSGFMQPTTQKNIPCVPATKTCIDGQWMGPEVFVTCTEI